MEKVCVLYEKFPIKQHFDSIIYGIETVLCTERLGAHYITPGEVYLRGIAVS